MKTKPGTVSVWSSSIDIGIIIIIIIATVAVVVVLGHEQHSPPLVSCARVSPARHAWNNTQI